MSERDPKGTTMTEQTQPQTPDEMRDALMAHADADRFALNLAMELSSVEWKRQSALDSVDRYADSIKTTAERAVNFARGERDYLDTLGSYAQSYDEAVNKFKAVDERRDALMGLAQSYLDARATS